MKGNLKHKVTFLLLFLCFCSVKSTWAQEDCSNKVSLKEITTTTIEEKSGSVTINVISEGRFESKLFMITGAGKILLETQSGEGDKEVIFENLAADDNLQVLVTFLDEKGGWCKRRQISEIKTFEN